MRIMYHKKSFLYGLTKPYLGQCDFMLDLKSFLKKVSLLQLPFDRLLESNNLKKLLSLVDDDSTNSIKTPDATDKRTFGLINADDYYTNDSAECQTRKCRILTIYNNNNNNNNNNYLNSENNNNNNFNDNDHDSSLHDNRTFGLVNNTNNDYPDGRVECQTLIIYNNNNNNNSY